MINKAAQILRTSLSAYMVELAVKDANHVIEEYESIKLSEEEGRKFLEIMNRPPQFKQKLHEHIKQYKDSL